ncbi:hypothetical protein B4U37_16120 [Sutcliffiella horikoshii]|uniref:Uncharacterized protein n=1 Tax=Sutcliffiella horikoshii TaxID=79883 RepID=A0ABM6KM00_9BACI|nr:hypothetical protein B4U37_16120 [Sutcliffiella horikoshii]
MMLQSPLLVLAGAIFNFWRGVGFGFLEILLGNRFWKSVLAELGHFPDDLLHFPRQLLPL